jgi:hypothetical protein
MRRAHPSWATASKMWRRPNEKCGAQGWNSDAKEKLCLSAAGASGAWTRRGSNITTSSGKFSWDFRLIPELLLAAG